MTKKRKVPIEKLKEAGRIARDMLVKRGIIAEDSLIDRIRKEEGAPPLPGLPNYLPHQWTLQASQRIMYDVLVMWRDECKGNAVKLENIIEFFKFVVKQLRTQEKKYKKEMREAKKLLVMDEVPTLQEVFSPMRKKETVSAIHRFFIDSFAIAVSLRKIESTSEYADWFLDWTQDLYALWVKADERDNIKRV